MDNRKSTDGQMARDRIDSQARVQETANPLHNKSVFIGDAEGLDEQRAAALTKLKAVSGSEAGDAVEAYVRAALAAERLQQSDSVAQSDAIATLIRTEATDVVSTFEVEKANWHQATTFFMLLREGNEEDRYLRYILLGVSFLLVTLQIAASAVVWFGAVLQTCATNNQCSFPGTFCSGRNICDYCGDIHPGVPPSQLDENGVAWNRGYDPGYKLLKQGGDELVPGATDWSGQYNITTVAHHCATASTKAATSWCAACYHPWAMEESDRVDATIFSEDVTQQNVRGMSTLDQLVLLLASGVVGMAVAAEVRDVWLCDLALSRAVASGSEVKSSTLVALSILSWLRRCVFLPALVSVVPWLVICKGASAYLPAFFADGAGAGSADGDASDLSGRVFV